MVLKQVKFLVIAGLFLSACNNNKEVTAQHDSYPVTNVALIDTAVYTDYVTELHATQNVEIRARVSGYLEKNWIDEGAHVRKGQLLFTINSQEYQQEVAKAKAQYKSAIADVKAAELELKNVTNLSKNKIVSVTELELARNRLDAQKAKMEEALAHQQHAQFRLSQTEIRAPFDGIINRIPHKMGSLIEEGTLLTSISSSDEVYAYFDVSEREYLNFAKRKKSTTIAGEQVKLILADGEAYEEIGTIETVEGAIDANTGTIAFRARFKNSEKLIKHGASGKVRLSSTLKQVLVIPQKSCFEVQDKLFVFVVDDEGKVHTRNIVIMHRMPHLYVVKSGLKKGERIVYEGIQRLKDNQQITVEAIPFQRIIKQLKEKEE